MTTREKEEVTEATRTYASFWVHRLEHLAKSHGYRWHTPTTQGDTPLGEVAFQWRNEKTHKRLCVYVEGTSVTYLRYWGTDQQRVVGRGPSSEEGECSWFDHALLLWHWLYM